MPQHSRISQFGGRVTLSVDSAQVKELKKRLQPGAEKESERKVLNGKHVVGDLSVRVMTRNKYILGEVKCDVYHEWKTGSKKDNIAAYESVKQQLVKLLEGETTDVTVTINELRKYEVESIINISDGDDENHQITEQDYSISSSCPIQALKSYASWQLVSISGETIISVIQLAAVYRRALSTGVPKFRKQHPQEVIGTDGITTFKLRRRYLSNIDIQLLPTGFTLLSASVKNILDKESIYLDLICRCDKYKSTPTTILGFNVNQRYKSSEINNSNNEDLVIGIYSNNCQRCCSSCAYSSRVRNELKTAVETSKILNSQSHNHKTVKKKNESSSDSKMTVDFIIKNPISHRGPDTRTGHGIINLLISEARSILNTTSGTIATRRVEVILKSGKKLVLWGDTCGSSAMLNSPVQGIELETGGHELGSLRRVALVCSKIETSEFGDAKGKEATRFKITERIRHLIEKVTTRIESEVSAKLQMSLGGMQTIRKQQLGPILDHDGAKRTVVYEEDVRRVKRIFDAMDSDKSGYLTLHELVKFSAAHPTAIPNRVFRFVVGDGERVGFLELLHCHFPKCSVGTLQSAIDKWSPPEVQIPTNTVPLLVTSEITNIFNTFDNNKKGFITTQELGSQLSKSEFSSAELTSLLNSRSKVITAADFINVMSGYFSPQAELLPLNTLSHRVNKTSHIRWSNIFPSGSAEKYLESPLDNLIDSEEKRTDGDRDRDVPPHQTT